MQRQSGRFTICQKSTCAYVSEGDFWIFSSPMTNLGVETSRTFNRLRVFAEISFLRKNLYSGVRNSEICSSSNLRRILLQGSQQLISATRSMSKAKMQIFTWVSMRRGTQWNMGVILIWVRFSERKQRSMTISPLYPQAASSILMVSSLVSRTHLPSYFSGQSGYCCSLL